MFDLERPPLGALGRALREPLNAITHGVGAVLAIVGGVVLVALSAGDGRRMVAFTIYAVTLFLLFLASTLLHAVRARPEVLRRLRIFDHAAIYLLIAGTYTPIALVTLTGVSPAWGWTLLGVAWGAAGLGVLFKLAWLDAPRWLSTALYLALGWMAVVAIAPLVQALPWSALAWLAAGGAFYSVGAVVYARKRPDPFPRVFGYHEIWHLFVLAGATCHYVLMLRYVLPA
jgi:hemolysin III